MIEPHGGKLVEQYIFREDLEHFKTGQGIYLTERLLYDALMIGIGGYSPLTGFISEEDYLSIIERMRLRSGQMFAIPIVLPVSAECFARTVRDEIIVLKNLDGNRIGVIEVCGKFRRNLEREALKVYSTADRNHPGVQKIFEEGNYALSGKIRIALENIDTGFPDFFLTPQKTRAFFESKNWKTIVAFQTRNPIHRAHEYLTKVALEMVDGLMIHPIVGEVKHDDIPADVRMHCYITLLKNYYNQERVLLNILPMAMRYAGPKEAIHHAIIRQNYGCSHIIVGRDHAGVGNYYGTYDAQRIFTEIAESDLKIKPIMFDHAFYCTTCGQIVTVKTCPHNKDDHLILSGTKVREMLKNGEDLPEEFTRREVANILRNWIKKNKNN
jgi:sulfate adenylyltransferase